MYGSTVFRTAIRVHLWNFHKHPTNLKIFFLATLHLFIKTKFHFVKEQQKTTYSQRNASSSIIILAWAGTYSIRERKSRTDMYDSWDHLVFVQFQRITILHKTERTDIIIPWLLKWVTLRSELLHEKSYYALANLFLLLIWFISVLWDIKKWSFK